MNLSELTAAIEQAMPGDRFAFRRRLGGIKRAIRDEKPHDKILASIAKDVAQSIEVRRQRADTLPEISFPQELPITQRWEEIRDALTENQVVVVSGDTGSGKSTQLPKICLAAGRGVDGVIGHTQPRRIAARSIASRLAEELKTTVGTGVGYKVRFTDATAPTTHIKLMTDGILLAETAGDRYLNQYDTIIIDEAHERSLNIDFLLGYLKQLLPKRRDLKVIITSATIDAERFAEHFSSESESAPIIEVSGRTYPIETLYRPVDEHDDLHTAVADAVEEAASIGGGDMLVFLPTERDIRTAARVLRGRDLVKRGNTEVLPLYARLSVADQNRVFASHKGRRIVLSTNVAESSLTVPGIRFVIDTGTARMSRYSARSKLQRLPIEAVSQASADQRKGRCGRVGPGVCIRLFSEEDYLSREAYTTPEIRRSNLAAVILQAESLQLGSLEDFPFLDPPRSETIRDGYRTLFELGAVNDKRQITPLGRELGRLPVDPRIGRMVLAAIDENCLSEMLVVASALEVQDPRERPIERQQDADASHSRHAHAESDFLGYLKLWEFFHKLRDDLSHNQLRKACLRNFMNYNRMREWVDVHRQLKELVKTSSNDRPPRRKGKRKNTIETTAIRRKPVFTSRRSPDDETLYEPLHRALLTGLLSGIAQKTDKHEYTGAGGVQLVLWPGSGAFEGKPQWIVGAELVETSRQFIRTVARVDPAWVEPIAQHLVKRSYSEPHWSRKTSSAMAYERVNLFGLPIVMRRRVRYGAIDPVVSRDLLIREGLTPADFKRLPPFLKHNLAVVEEVTELADKTRQRGFLVDDMVLYAFYDSRIPEQGVYDWSTLDQWLRKQNDPNGDCLMLSPSDLLPAETEETADSFQKDFPPELTFGDITLPATYRFQPGEEDDGVTIIAPPEAAAQLTPHQLGWLVPGLLEEKIIALIRSLPKPVRRKLTPAPDTARQVVASLEFGKGSFYENLSHSLGSIAGEPISPELFNSDSLPQHLQVNIRVVDGKGEVVSEGRELTGVREQAGVSPAVSNGRINHPQYEKEGIKSFAFDTIAKQIEVERGGVTIPAFPALVDEGDSVSLRLFDSRDLAKQNMYAGLRRLFFLAESQSLNTQVKYLPHISQIEVLATPLANPKQLRQQLAELIADRAYLSQKGLPYSQHEFQTRLAEGRDNSIRAVQQVSKFVGPFFEAYQAARLAWESLSGDRYGGQLGDIKQQAKELTIDRFLVNTPWRWLNEFPRFFRAIASRIEKLKTGGETKDRQAMNELKPWLEKWRQRAEAFRERAIFDPELEWFRWMLEEYRVSLFAQQLGTSLTISSNRLEKQWKKVQPLI